MNTSVDLECKCGCGLNNVHPTLATAIHKLERRLQCELNPTSGCRCFARNTEEGGRPNSYHLLGMAADVWCSKWTPEGIAAQAEHIQVFKEGGIGIYNTFVHLDVRGCNAPARW